MRAGLYAEDRQSPWRAMVDGQGLHICVPWPHVDPPCSLISKWRSSPYLQGSREGQTLPRGRAWSLLVWCVSGEQCRGYRQEAWVQTPARSLPRCAPMGHIPNLSEPLSTHGNDGSPSWAVSTTYPVRTVLSRGSANTARQPLSFDTSSVRLERSRPHEAGEDFGRARAHSEHTLPAWGLDCRAAPRCWDQELLV